MIPSGYEKLATIGILYRGEYSPDEQYKFLSAVYHSGSTYVALKDNPSGAPAGDGVNWQYMAKGFVEGVLSAVNAQDTAGVLGTAGKIVNSQTLVDAIADKVMTKLLQKNKILQTVEQVMASKDADNVTGSAATAELNRKLDGFKIHETGIYTAAYEADQYTYTFADFTIIIPINLMVRGSSDVKMLGVTHLKNTIYFRAINFNTMSEFKNSPISFSGCLLVK